jgi:hypothetical protein
MITFSEKFGSKLRRPSRTELQRLVSLAAAQVGEVEKALHIYVELLNTKQVKGLDRIATPPERWSVVWGGRGEGGN